MPETRRHTTLLKTHGDEADISVRQLMVLLKWTGDVDLDLLTFYAAKDGRAGGVFSTSYPGGSRGDLNHFPFIEPGGDVAVICKIDNTRPQMSPRLVNVNRMMGCKDFMSTIPGAGMFVRIKADH